MTQDQAQEGAVCGEIDVLKQQVESCLGETYVALSKTLQNSITKAAQKAISVPLSVIVAVLPTPHAKIPEQLSVRRAIEELDCWEFGDDDVVTYSGRSVPNNSRMRECRRKSVIVDRLPAGSTTESIQELLSGCGRVVFAVLCHPRLTASYVKGAVRSHTLHAIVQFATVQEAVRAVETMNFSWRGGPRVTHAMTEFRAPSPLRPRNQNAGREGTPSTDASSTDGSMNDGDELFEALRAQGQGSENADVPKKSKKNKGKKGRAKADVDGNKAQGSKKPEQASTKRDYASWAAATPENRAQPLRFVNSRSAPSAPGAPIANGLRPRMPRGPDGTRGFTMGRGRPLPIPVPA